MATGNVDWFHAVPRTQRCSNLLTALVFVEKRHPASRASRQLSMRANQNAFCTPDRRPVEQNAQVACQSHPAGMRVSLPIAKEQIGQLLQFLQCREERRDLAEAQKTGEIWKLQRHDCVSTLD